LRLRPSTENSRMSNRKRTMTDGTVSRWEDPATFWSMVTDELTWQSREATVMQGELPNFSFFRGVISMSVKTVSITAEMCIDNIDVNKEERFLCPTNTNKPLFL
jgi:hypothetical protein